MTLLRGIWDDLVDKRLWPVAAVLAIALVAAPVMLLRGGGAPAPVAPPPAPVAPGSAIAAAQPAVSVGQAPSRHRLAGHERDPFVQRAAASAATGTSVASSSAPGPATAGSGAGSSATVGGSTGVPAPAGTATGSSGSPGSGGSGSAVDEPPVTVRFGKAGGSEGRRVVQPLQALPSSANPLVVYLGETDGKAAFLVSSDATPSGQVSCKPSKKACEKALVAPGDTMSIDVQDVSGTTQYVVEVLHF
jgi:hypothetical protein